MFLTCKAFSWIINLSRILYDSFMGIKKQKRARFDKDPALFDKNMVSIYAFHTRLIFHVLDL